MATLGYMLYMDGGNDGDFRLIYNGTSSPGVLEYPVTGLALGYVYRFKVSAVNFNGEGPESAEASIHACLAPSNFSEPLYVNATENDLTVSWSSPNLTNGCPIYKYQLFRDAGDTPDAAVSTQVGTDLGPQVLQQTITLTGQASKTFRV